jgi:hypothetical protein
LKIEEIVKILKAKEIFIPEEIKDFDIEYAGASDLMSDVLAFSRENMFLITGLASPQTITTAAVIGAKGIIFARGKEIPNKVIEIAKEFEITLISTKLSMLMVCVVLHNSGIKDAMGTERELE